MPREVLIEVAGQKLVLFYGHAAVCQFERALGGNLAAYSQASVEHGTHLLHACLEGGRRKSGQQRAPWTFAEVCDLVDAAGGLEAFSAGVQVAAIAGTPAAEPGAESAPGKGAASTGTA